MDQGGHIKNNKIVETRCILNMSRKIRCINSRDQETELDYPSASDTVSFSVGSQHICVYHMSGKLFCYGSNKHNQLTIPHDIVHSNSYVTIGFKHICTFESVNFLSCMGSNK